MTHQSNPIGNEITCIMHGIKDEVLNDVERLEQLLDESAAVENFKVLKKSSHAFTPRGYTALLLITESHIAIHTYPEYSCLVFNLYSCRSPQDGRKTLEYFQNALKPEKVEFRENNVVISCGDGVEV